MITRLFKGTEKREVITSRGVGPYSGNLKIVYWLGSNSKGIIDLQWHDHVIEQTWKAAKEKHCEFVKRFMNEGWKEQSGKTLKEVIQGILKKEGTDSPDFKRSEKAINALRAKGGRTAQARAKARKERKNHE